MEAPAERRSEGPNRRLRCAPHGFMLLLIVFGAVLRVWVAVRGGLWRDEALFLSIASSGSVRDMLQFLRWHESHPPLFYLLTRTWVSLGHSELWALVLPLAFGVVSIPVIYMVGRRMFSENCGLIAALFAAMSPILSGHSGMLRPYSFLELLSLIGVFLLWVGLRGGNAAWWGYVVVMAAMVLTHTWSWLLIGAHAVVASAWFIFGPGREAGVIRRWMLAQAGILVLYAPWLKAVFFQAQHAGYPAMSVIDWTLPLALAPAVTGMPLPIAVLVTAFGAVSAISRPERGVTGNSGPRLGLLLCAGVPASALSAGSDAFQPLQPPDSALPRTPDAFVLPLDRRGPFAGSRTKA